MTRQNKERCWTALIIVVSVIALASQANASGDRVTQSNDMNNQTTGDVATTLNTGGNDALGIGFSSPSFTSAISQCLATKSSNWLFGAYGAQKIVSNYHCMGLAYLSAGMTTAGEYILCTHTELSNLPDCESAIKEFKFPSAPPPDANAEGGSNLSDVLEQFAEDDQYQREQYEEQMMLVADLQAKYDNLASADPVQVTTREIVEVQQPFLISKELANELRVKGNE